MRVRYKTHTKSCIILPAWRAPARCRVRLWTWGGSGSDYWTVVARCITHEVHWVLDYKVQVLEHEYCTSNVEKLIIVPNLVRGEQ